VAKLRSANPTVAFLSVEPLLEDLGAFDLRGIQWVIVGGESGPGARPMHAEWVRRVRDQCRKTNTAFFFKQWGGVRKKQAGRQLDGRTYDEYPGFASVASLEGEQRRSLLREVEMDYLAGGSQ
jgi:protein gp37